MPLPEIEVHKAHGYYAEMARRNRLIAVTDRQGAVFLFCTFFVLPGEHTVLDFYCRSTWSTPEDVEDGAVIYVDQLVGNRFSREVLSMIEEKIISIAPSANTAIWYSPGQTRDVRHTYTRGRLAHAQYH